MRLGQRLQPKKANTTQKEIDSKARKARQKFPTGLRWPEKSSVTELRLEEMCRRQQKMPTNLADAPAEDEKHTLEEI